jgi:hypothetical protein
MTNNSTYRLDDSFRRHLPQAIAAAEGHGEVGFPRSGTSGLSVGAFQIDLAARPDEARRFIDAGVASGAIRNRAEAERLFSLRFDADRMRAGTPARTQFEADRTAAMRLGEQALRHPEVRAVVDQASRRQVDDLVTATTRVCAQAAPQARAFCGSRQGQLEIATYLHQFGHGDTQKIESYLRGEAVTLGAGAQVREVQIDGTLDAEQFRNGYQGSTRWGQTNRPGLTTRHLGIDGFLRREGIDDGSRARINPERRSEAEGTEPAQVAQARPDAEAAREQSANAGAGFARAAAHRTNWTPDPAKIGEAVASLGAADLPGWTQNLLARDALANGEDAAVKGFQRAINAATKPPSFDYHWGLGGRTGRVDVDGDLGPQTRSGFGRALDKQGEDGFAKLYALDQFGRYVKNVDRGRAKLDDFEDTLAGTLGQAKPDAPERAQETINFARHDRGDPFEPLKVDGWIGPKSTEAFKTTLHQFGPDRLMERFGGKDFWDDEGLA